MNEQQTLETTVFIMFYGGVTVLSLIACLYLLFRRGNAFAADVTSPARLRHWTAVFFAAFTLGHLWYLPSYFSSSNDDMILTGLIGGLLDTMIIFPLAIIILFCMLQDRKRPLWPAALMVAPLVAGMAWSIYCRSMDFLPVIRVYFLLMCMGLGIYMVREVRRYGRWLRDNYADLEHKEVSQSLVVMAIILFVFVFYVAGYGLPAYEYVTQMVGTILICFLLWRVETLSDLSLSQSVLPSEEEEPVTAENQEDYALAQASDDNTRALLKEHCEDTELYLLHDLTLYQLAKTIGTNRTYLTRYFARQGTTYNAYINSLRIKHFVSLSREAAAAQRPFTAQKLAHESGFQSYSTFSLAFKQRMGQTASSWMRELLAAALIIFGFSFLTSCSSSDNDPKPDTTVLDQWEAGKTVTTEAITAFGGFDRCFAAEPIPDGVWQRMQGKTYKENPYIQREDLRHVKALLRPRLGLPLQD